MVGPLPWITCSKIESRVFAIIYGNFSIKHPSVYDRVFFDGVLINPQPRHSPCTSVSHCIPCNYCDILLEEKFCDSKDSFVQNGEVACNESTTHQCRSV